jgi:hypothetical protein
MPQLFYTIGSYEIIQENIQNAKNKFIPFYNQVNKVNLPVTRYTVKPKSSTFFFDNNNLVEKLK